MFTLTVKIHITKQRLWLLVAGVTACISQPPSLDRPYLRVQADGPRGRESIERVQLLLLRR